MFSKPEPAQFTQITVLESPQVCILERLTRAQTLYDVNAQF